MLKDFKKPHFIFMTIMFSLFMGCVTSNKVTNEDTQWQRNKPQLLEDSQDLISADFKIPKTLKNRVSFWMDIYGRYDSKVRVIHDSSYPWVVYEVVDTRGMARAEQFIKKRISFYKKSLKNISKTKKASNSTERKLLTLYKYYPKYIYKAHKNVRSQTGQRDHMKAGLLRSQDYLAHMEEIFEERGMPTELTRLPFVESSFNWKAHSKAGARGIWQFMRGTGRKFMRVNRYYDERMSPLKSTHAAAKLLKQNHRILDGHWSLALTAYNHGPGGVKKASQKVGSTDMGIIADNYRGERFSFASANFYSSFLAALYVEKYKDIVFSDLIYKRAPNIIVKKTKKRMRAKTLLKKTGMTRTEFLNWNPDLTRALKRNYRVPRHYTYYISVPKRLAYNDSIAE